MSGAFMFSAPPATICTVAANHIKYVVIISSLYAHILKTAGTGHINAFSPETCFKTYCLKN